MSDLSKESIAVFRKRIQVSLYCDECGRGIHAKTIKDILTRVDDYGWTGDSRGVRCHMHRDDEEQL